MSEAIKAIKEAIEAIDPWLPEESKIEQTHTILRQLPNGYDYKVYRYGIWHYVCIIPPLPPLLFDPVKHEDMFGCDMFDFKPHI